MSRYGKIVLTIVRFDFPSLVSDSTNSNINMQANENNIDNQNQNKSAKA